MNEKRLDIIRERMIVKKHHFKYLNNDKGYFEDVYTLVKEDMKYLFEQAGRAQELEDYNTRLLIKRQQEHAELDGLNKQNKRYREVIASMKSEINYALNSNKSEDIKRFYLENAIRFAGRALESESNDQETSKEGTS